MKVKNLNLAERYIEKVVIALAVLFALAVIWFKFAGEPYAIPLPGGGASVAPGQVEEQIEREAKTLLREVEKTEVPPELKNWETTDYLGKLADLLRTKIDVRPLRISIGAMTPDPDEFGDFKGVGEPILLVPDPPAPTSLAVKQGFGVLAEPANVKDVKIYERLVGPQLPRDIRWVSVSASFNFEDWRVVLESDPTEPNLNRIPEQIWRDKIAITDVILERQEWDVQKDDWGEIRRISALPNNMLGYRNPPASWPAEQAIQTVRWIKENRRDVTKPPFPHLKRGVWKRPDVDFNKLNAQQKRQFEQLAVQIEQLQQRIAAMEMQGDQEGDKAIKPAVPGGQPPAGGPAAGVVNRGAAAARRGGNRLTNDKSPANNLESLRKYLDQLIRQNEAVLGVGEEEDIDLLGDNMDGADQFDGDEAGRQRNAIPNKVTVWAHDISVRPGKSYRYRLLVDVLNPLFRDRRIPDQQQKEYYDKLSITSVASEWTSYVTIDANTHFFVVGAHKLKNTARIEVYTIFNGRVIYRVFTPSPGDLIGGSVELSDEGFQRNVNLEIGAALIDIQFDVPSHGGLTDTTHRIICLDEATGNLFERTVEDNSKHPDRLKLKHEAERRKVARNN